VFLIRLHNANIQKFHYRATDLIGYNRLRKAYNDLLHWTFPVWIFDDLSQLLVWIFVDFIGLLVLFFVKFAYLLVWIFDNLGYLLLILLLFHESGIEQ
jgi:hypothetical protein